MTAKMFAVIGLAALLLAALPCEGQQYGISGGMITLPWGRENDVNKAMMTARGLVPRDQWRIVNGVTNYISGPGFSDYFLTKDPVLWQNNGRKKVFADGWFIAAGKVVEVQSIGIRVRGYCNYFTETVGHVVVYPDTGVKTVVKEPKEMIFFIANYPYPVSENDDIPMCVVKEAGIYTWRTLYKRDLDNTVSSGSASIHKFDYGLATSRPVAPTPPPPTAEELQAAQAATARKKAELQANAVKYEKGMADKGDCYNQRRIGERYRDGDGVKKSMDAARTWLTLAAGQGDKEAARELNELLSK